MDTIFSSAVVFLINRGYNLLVSCFFSQPWIQYSRQPLALHSHGYDRCIAVWSSSSMDTIFSSAVGVEQSWIPGTTLFSVVVFSQPWVQSSCQPLVLLNDGCNISHQPLPLLNHRNNILSPAVGAEKQPLMHQVCDIYSAPHRLTKGCTTRPRLWRRRTRPRGFQWRDR